MFLYGSRSADPHLWITNPDPDPSLSISRFQDAKKVKLLSHCFAYYSPVLHVPQSWKNINYLEVTTIHRNQIFSCTWIRICTDNIGSVSYRPSTVKDPPDPEHGPCTLYTDLFCSSWSWATTGWPACQPRWGSSLNCGRSVSPWISWPPFPPASRPAPSWRPFSSPTIRLELRVMN